jgi:hypothetical protein
MNVSKICTTCNIEKNIESDFYCYSKNGTKKAICKECEKTTANKIELSTCPMCDIVIRKTGMKTHEKSKRHENARFCNVSYDYNRLPHQMRRRK